MIGNLLRKVNVPIFILALLGCMALGTLSCWAYIFVLKTEVRVALRKSEPKAKTTPQPEVQTTPAPTETPDPEDLNQGGNTSGFGPMDKGMGRMKRPRTRLRAKGPSNLPPDLQELVKGKHLFGVAIDNVILQAILGDSALINNQWMKLGQEVEGMKLEELRNDVAVVTLNGERREVPLWISLPGTGEPGSEMMQPGGDFGLRRGFRSTGDRNPTDRRGFGSGNMGSGNRTPMTDEERERKRQERREEWKKRFEERQSGSSQPTIQRPSNAQRTPKPERTYDSERRSNFRKGM